MSETKTKTGDGAGGGTGGVSTRGWMYFLFVRPTLAILLRPVRRFALGI